MADGKKARAVGFNHVALEVGDIEEALAFYGRLFEFKLRGKSRTSAFIDLGDQFLALQKGRPSYLAFLFSISMRTLAAGPDEAGF
jgi:catechol 2,3-dioxygenase-like lactoylglutathione lyase family enzyme